MKNLSRSLLTMSLLSALALGAVSPSYALNFSSTR